MKTNAIIRIVLFSLAIIVLGGILVAGIGLNMYSFDFSFGEGNTGITDGTVGTQGSVPADRVRDIKIDWVAGTITLIPDENASDITFWDEGAEDEKHQMIWKQSGDTLSIQYEKSKVYVGIQVTEESKDLTITVPADWVCRSLEIDAASAEVQVVDLTLGEVDFDGASGICTFENCIVGELDVDTASGDLFYNGQLETLNVSSMSANCEVVLTKAPREIDLESMSGDLFLTLPEDCGFSVDMNAMSSDFSTDFETVTTNGRHVHGDGSCRIDIEAMSGDVCIYKHTGESHHSDWHHG